MIKITVSSYNQSALRHLGAALAAMADDITRDCIPKECCGLSDPLLATAAVPAPPVVQSLTDVEPPVSVFTGGFEHGIPAPPPPADSDAGWPDPPQPEEAPTDHLDADGVPWDVRIHAGTKTRLKASNTWKLKPGVDKALVDQVIAELKGIQAIPVPPTPTLADAALQAPPPPPPAPAGPSNFAELIKEVTGLITAGQMTPDQVNSAVSIVTNGQLTMCNQLAARQDLIPAVWSVLCPTAA